MVLSTQLRHDSAAGKFDLAQVFLKIPFVFRKALAPVAVDASLVGAAEFVDQKLQHDPALQRQQAVGSAHSSRAWCNHSNLSRSTNGEYFIHRSSTLHAIS